MHSINAHLHQYTLPVSLWKSIHQLDCDPASRKQEKLAHVTLQDSKDDSFYSEPSGSFMTFLISLREEREGHQKFLYFLPELSHLFLTHSPASQSVGLKETRKDGKGMPVDRNIPNGLNPNGPCLIHHNEGWGLEGF